MPKEILDYDKQAVAISSWLPIWAAISWRKWDRIRTDQWECRCHWLTQWRGFRWDIWWGNFGRCHIYWSTKLPRWWKHHISTCYEL